MRAILLILLLGNALFLAWVTWIDPAVPAAATAIASLPALQVLPALAAQGSAATPPAPSGTAPAVVAVPPPAAPAPDVATRCSSFGPLPDAEASRAVQVALEARKLSGRERTSVAEELEGYWVHIDRLADESARTRAIHRLQVANIRGAVALADTSQVSVGVFSERDAAEQRAAAVGKLGYKAEVGPRNHVVTRYWLDVEAPTSVPLPSVDALVGDGKGTPAPAWSPCAAPGAAAGGAAGGAVPPATAPAAGPSPAAAR